MSEQPVKPADLAAVPNQLLGDIRQMIEETRAAVAATVNAGLTMLYWRIGDRINQEVLKGKRGDYGKQILATLSQELAHEYGGSFAEKNLRRMVQFAEVFPDERILVSLIRELSWTHFIALIPLKHPLEREFYAEMCRVERWSVRTLRQKIASMLYERTALSKKPAELARLELQSLREEDQMTPDLVFRDPYLLDFLGLKGAYQEKDLEAAILRELEAFIMELGVGFTFVSRQKRIIVDHDDFYLDLLFFHRDLRRLVAVELKLDKFRPDHKGQMELYLRWLDRHERKPGEDSPLGIILCAGKNSEQIELLELGRSGIHVAEYLTVLPPKDVLKRKLHEAIERSRLALENRGEEAGEASAKAIVKENLTVRPEDARKKLRQTEEQEKRAWQGGPVMIRPAYQQYRPSGVEWLGDVPEHWDFHRLKYLASINDEALPETTDPDYEFTYVDIGSVDAARGIVTTETYRFADAPSRARRIVHDGDTIVSTVRTYLRAIASIQDPNDNLIVSTGFAVVRPRRIDPGYLSYALRSPFFVETVVSRSTGVSYPAINATEIGNIGITIPPLSEQRGIAGFLDRETTRIDALIEKKQRQIELLQEKRSALISHAVTKGLDPNAKMKDSGIEWLGEIPEKWDVKPLKFLFRFISGGTPSTTDQTYWAGEVPWVSAKDMKTLYLYDTEDHMALPGFEWVTPIYCGPHLLCYAGRSGI